MRLLSCLVLLDWQLRLKMMHVYRGHWREPVLGLAQPQMQLTQVNLVICSKSCLTAETKDTVYRQFRRDPLAYLLRHTACTAQPALIQPRSWTSTLRSLSWRALISFWPTAWGPKQGRHPLGTPRVCLAAPRQMIPGQHPCLRQCMMLSNGNPITASSSTQAPGYLGF